MRARTLGTLAIAIVLVAGCQGARGGGGGARPAARQPGYNPMNQPAVNQQGTPGPVIEGGRVGRDAGGPNAGAYSNTPSEGYRGSGSSYNPPTKRILERHKTGTSPSPFPQPKSR